MSDPHDEIRRRIEAASEPPPVPEPPEATVADLLRTAWKDSGGGDAVDLELDRLAQDPRGRRYLERAADALDALLAAPPAPPRLLELVAWEANVGLDERSEAAAADWLGRFSARVRARLAP